MRLFSCIAIDMLALYFPAGDIALCRACYRWSIVLQGASIQLYCYRPAGSLLASVGLHSVEPAIVRLSFCRSCLFRCIAIALLALYLLALVCTLQSVLSSVYRPAGAIYSAVLLSFCWLSIVYRWSALCRACYRPSIALQGLFIQLYCYRYASSLYPC